MMGSFYTARNSLCERLYNNSSTQAALSSHLQSRRWSCSEGPGSPAHLCALENVSPALLILAILASLSLFSSFLLPLYGKVKT